VLVVADCSPLIYLVQARQSDVLPALKPVLDALVAEGFRIAPALVQ
jgi:hypothetical protein